MPAKPFLSIEPRVLDAHRVQLTIGTNLPMPIKVATSIDLHGQKGTDTYIGYSEFVTLTGATTVAVLDTSKADTFDQAAEKATEPEGEAYQKGYFGHVPSRDGDKPVDLTLAAVTGRKGA